MDLTNLRYFQAAARAGNISRAAEELYISRQALSRAVKRLERQAGARLVVPTAQGISLTAEGEVLFAAVEQILPVWDEAVRTITAMRSDSVLIRVGYGHNSYNLWPAGHLRCYTELHPEIRLQYQSLPPDALLEGLREGTLDLAISNVRPLQDDLVFMPFLRRPVYAMLSGAHPLAKNSVLKPGDLAGRNVLFIPDDRTGAAHFSHLMEVYGFTFTPVVSADSTIITICNELAYHEAVFITSAIFGEDGRQRDCLLIPFETGLPRDFYNLDINAVTRRLDAGRRDIGAYVAYLQENVRPEFDEAGWAAHAGPA